MKRIVTLILVFTALIVNTQRTMFAGNTNSILSSSITDWSLNTTKAISLEAWINYNPRTDLQFYFTDAWANFRFGF
jgi:hypothetical protein